MSRGSVALDREISPLNDITSLQSQSSTGPCCGNPSYKPFDAIDGKGSNRGVTFTGAPSRSAMGTYSSYAASQSSKIPAIAEFSLPQATLPGRKSGLARSVPSLHAKKSKTQPRNTDATWDVETLQELVMSFKRKVSELEKSRRLLRSQYQKAQERLLAKDREIDSILQKVAGGAALMNEKSMVRALKHQVRNLQDLLSEKSSENDQLRRTMKNTQIQEMLIYCDDFAQEVRRLRLFNELGRTAETHVTVSALEEIRALRHECNSLRYSNADLTTKLSQTELSSEQSRARDRQHFSERIQKMEDELRQERALVAEMEKIGELTRAELAQIAAQTETTRISLAESAAQIRLLRERVASQEVELQAQKVAAANSSEKAKKDHADLVALKDSMEKKLLLELTELHETIEKQRLEKAVLQESERILKNTVEDLKRVCDETKQNAIEDRQHLLDKLQNNEKKMDAIAEEKRTIVADLVSVKTELELSAKALQKSQQSYEQAKAELFALEKELQRVNADAERTVANQKAEIAQQEATLRAQQDEVERLRALNENASKKLISVLTESPQLQTGDVAVLDKSDGEPPNADVKDQDESEKQAVESTEPLQNRGSDGPNSSVDHHPAEVSVNLTEAADLSNKVENTSERSPRRDKDRRNSGSKGTKDKTNVEKDAKQSSKSRGQEHKERPDKTKTDKRSDKKTSIKQGAR